MVFDGWNREKKNREKKEQKKRKNRKREEQALAVCQAANSFAKGTTIF